MFAYYYYYYYSIISFYRLCGIYMCYSVVMCLRSISLLDILLLGGHLSLQKTFVVLIFRHWCRSYCCLYCRCWPKHGLLLPWNRLWALMGLSPAKALKIQESLSDGTLTIEVTGTICVSMHALLDRGHRQQASPVSIDYLSIFLIH